MNDEQLLRYSRHILLPGLGIEGQKRLLQSHAVIVGAGGLGSPVSLYLGSAGVGQITVIDPDVVDATNLQRQVAHTLDRLGHPKAESACNAIRAINRDVQLRALCARADAQSLAPLLSTADIVLDCTDNFATRHAINAACVSHRLPLVSGAATGYDGQVSVFHCKDAQSPCYACLFPPELVFEEVRCATMGVFAPVVGVIGTIQATEALKLLCSIGSSLSGRLLMLDGRAMVWNEVRFQASKNCPVCQPRNPPASSAQSPLSPS